MSKSYDVNPGFSQPGVKTLLNSLEQHIFYQIVLIHAAWHSILPLFKDGTDVPHYPLNLKTSFPAMPVLAPASIYIMCENASCCEYVEPMAALCAIFMLETKSHSQRICRFKRPLRRNLFLETSFLKDLIKSSQTV